MSDKHPRQHKSYKVEIRVIEEVDEWRSKEDLHGGPGYYPGEIVLLEKSITLSTRNLSSTIEAVATDNHNLIDWSRS